MRDFFIKFIGIISFRRCLPASRCLKYYASITNAGQVLMEDDYSPDDIIITYTQSRHHILYWMAYVSLGKEQF